MKWLLALVTVVAIVAGRMLLSADPPDIDKLVAKLGDESTEVREEAMRELAKLGPAAKEALARAAKSDDPEIRARALLLLKTLEWPEPGPEAKGLVLAVRAESTYANAEPLTMRGRLTNVSDHAIRIVGAAVADLGEEETFSLSLDGGEALHLCFNRKEPAPRLSNDFTIEKGGSLEFEFSPRAWCFSPAHSKCCPVQIGPGEHTIVVTLVLPQDASVDGSWTGAVASNKVAFRIDP